MLAGSGEWELRRQVWRRRVVLLVLAEGRLPQVQPARVQPARVRVQPARQRLAPWQLLVRLQLLEASAPGQCRPRRS